MAKADKRQKRARRQTIRKKQSLTRQHEENRCRKQLRAISNAILPDPYQNPADLESDLKLADEAVTEYFGEVPEDFIPPFLIEDPDNDAISLHPWGAVFRDKMVDKYGSLEVAEPYLKYALGVHGERKIRQYAL